MRRGQQKRSRDPEERAAEIKRFLERISRAVKIGMSYDSASRAAGLNPSTFYAWKVKAKNKLEPYARLWSILDQAEAEGEYELIKRIDKASLGDWRAAAWILERRNRARWSDKSEVTLSTVSKAKKSIDDMTDDELDEFIRGQLESLSDVEKADIMVEFEELK